MPDALLGTTSGIHRVENDTLRSLGLDDRQVSAVHAFRNASGNLVLLAGTYGDGLFRSDDDGRSWTKIEQGLTSSAFRTIVPDPNDPSAILSGTEPGRIYRSTDTGLTWSEMGGILSLDHVDEWFLPYSPRAGAVRNIYSPPGTDRLLASVEVGGLLDSPDRGEAWTCRPILGDTDIHHITGHPHDPYTLYAALGWATLKSVPVPSDSPPVGGVGRSTDGGNTWTKLFTDYTRAVIVPPSHPELLLACPAKKVGALGRIQVSADGGDSWTPASDGIDSPMNDMVEEFIPAPDDSIWALRSGGTLYRAEPGEWRWHPVLDPNSGLNVKSVAFIP
jgi:hypothetical protein